MDVEDDSLTLREWAALHARAHWMLVTLVVAHLVLLTMVPGVWTKLVEVHSKHGRAWHIPLGERDLWVSGVGVVFYLLAGIGVPYHWGMRSPSEGEVTIARWLIRATGVAILLVGFAITIP